MAIPKFLQPCLASYDLSKLDARSDKRLIITEVLNKGDFKDLKWLGNTYSKKEIKEVVNSPTRGMWLRSTLSYWLRIFNLKPNNQDFEKSIININP